ncbi:MAG: reactive intermediate/imine deaminase [Gammaproteobacteria bacterium RIFCSPHIGHO2_12_FULL_41_15]|nr:MAG: reactive intermediate/imine deaminase [Gammaproteobacteria bacterium RIFCSPHIGHO2_12_FULL_41_15]
MQAIKTALAPLAIGTYSQAIQCKNLVFLSGQIALDPATMEMVSPDISPQIDQVFKNLSAVCQAAGGELKNIAKLQVYLTDLANFALVNEIMAKYFTEPYPARAAIGVKALPKNALVEMDGIMMLEPEDL